MKQTAHLAEKRAVLVYSMGTHLSTVLLENTCSNFRA